MSSKRCARNIVNRIVTDLTERKGLRQTWDDIDDDLQREIRDEWKEIVESELAKVLP